MEASTAYDRWCAKYDENCETGFTMLWPADIKNPPIDKNDNYLFSYLLFRGPNMEKVRRHYITTFEDAEIEAERFLRCEVLGLDTEFKPWCGGGGIKENVSVIQVASEADIALFHIALFEGEEPDELIPPVLKTILADANVLKAGSGIHGDAARLEKYLQCPVKGVVDLKTLLHIVHPAEKKQSATLDIMTRRYFELGLDKDTRSRCADWMQKMNWKGREYAASDAYASLKVFEAIDNERSDKGLPSVQYLLAANSKHKNTRKRKASQIESPTLYAALHKLRAEMATHDSPGWHIMTNKMMKDIATAAPVTHDELKGALGHRYSRVEEHSEAVVRTVATFVAMHRIGAKRMKSTQSNLDGWMSSSQRSGMMNSSQESEQTIGIHVRSCAAKALEIVDRTQSSDSSRGDRGGGIQVLYRLDKRRLYRG